MHRLNDRISRKTIDYLNSKYRRISRNINFIDVLRTTLFVVGIGASTFMIELFARIGIKRFFQFDLDLIEEKNLPCQNFVHSDIGREKTKASKNRLGECEFEKGNPDVPELHVETFGDFLGIPDEEIECLIENEKALGQNVIFVMVSDYHPVQARGNRISLKYEVPCFWSAIYKMGQAGEIIFYIPGHGLPCYRCITETRYNNFDEVHLENHLKGDSDGAGMSFGLPMAATFIDSILSHLIIGCIHRDIEDNPHGNLFRRLLREGRNFIQCQLDQSYLLNGKEDIFSQIQGPDQIAFNTIFQHEPRKHDCIDCQGYKNGRIWKHTDYTAED